MSLALLLAAELGLRVKLMPRTYVMAIENPNIISRVPVNIANARNNSTGGPPFEGAVRNRPGVNHASFDRAPGMLNDTEIVRQRNYLWRRAYAIPAAQAWHNPLADGPTRDMPTTRFNRNIRPIVGGSKQSSEGMHTYLPTGQQGSSQLAGKKRMMPGRQNRLTVQRYRGQSYSATTQVIA